MHVPVFGLSPIVFGFITIIVCNQIMLCICGTVFVFLVQSIGHCAVNVLMTRLDKLLILRC